MSTTVTERTGTVYAGRAAKESMAAMAPVPADLVLDYGKSTPERYADVRLPYATKLIDGKDEYGFVWCYLCHERLGSPFCCNQDARVVAKYRVHVGVVIEKAATLQQATPAEIVRRSPVNRAVA
jgi:hypothetical protein